MILGKVVERVVSTAKLAHLPARQMLAVQPFEGFGDPNILLIALDSVQAGPGDIVLVLQEGTGARQVLMSDHGDSLGEPLAAQMVVIGVVDQINL